MHSDFRVLDLNLLMAMGDRTQACIRRILAVLDLVVLGNAGLHRAAISKQPQSLKDSCAQLLEAVITAHESLETSVFTPADSARLLP